MIFGGEKVKYRDYQTFTEAEVPSDRNKPLEWRRSLNSIRIEASSFLVDQTHWVNKCDTINGIIRRESFDTSENSSIVETVKAEVNERRNINFETNFDSIRDSIYKTKSFDESAKGYDLEKISGKIIVSLSNDEPIIESWGLFSAGSYCGSSYIDEAGDNLHIDISLDKNSFNNLFDNIRENRVEKIILDVVIDSFSFEVDDALRDFHHSRNLFIHGFSAPSALQSLVIRGKSSTNSLPFLPSTTNDSDNKLATYFLENSNKIDSIIVIFPILKHIRNALWLIAFLIFLLALK